MNKRFYWLIGVMLVIILAVFTLPGLMRKDNTVTPEEPSAEVQTQAPAYWHEDSAVLKSIMEYTESVCDPASENYKEPSERIAVFDFDGTLYGELFPTYFDTWLFVHRALHDDTYTAPDDIREYAQLLEDAFSRHLPEPDSDKSTAQCTAEVFKGLTIDEYRDYIRAFMKEKAFGFEGMTYEEGFYLPMVSMVEYLDAHDFRIFISSGSERTMVRELIEGVLDEWITPDQVIGSSFSLMATNQGDKAGRSYNFKADDEVLMEGNLVSKNQKTNKVFSIIDEIGQMPVMVFGNSSGDLAMAQYCLQHGGRGYMLLCDDTERDYGDVSKAEEFKADCEKMGLETVSMKDDFTLIYEENARKTDD